MSDKGSGKSDMEVEDEPFFDETNGIICNSFSDLTDSSTEDEIIDEQTTIVEIKLFFFYLRFYTTRVIEYNHHTDLIALRRKTSKRNPF